MPRPTSTIIYTHGGGRFGNQLLRFLHWIAWAHEQQGTAEVVNLAFWPYSSFFARWADHPGCAYPMRDAWADRLAWLRGLIPDRALFHGEWRMQRFIAHLARYGRPFGVERLWLSPNEQLNLEDPSFLRRALRVRCLVCSGWQFQAWSLLEKHAGYIRRLFAPAATRTPSVDRFVSEIRKGHDLLVGLFIRRGDYREWAGGRFYFPLASYRRWAEEIIALHPGRRVAVVVAGDEPMPADFFRGLPVVFATGCVGGSGDWFESFLELAACDIIASPPSTFSACAAFLGDRPLWPLRSADQTLSNTSAFNRQLLEAANDSEFAIAVK